MPISGAAIESLFDYEMMSRGFTVSAPRSETSPYDRIVDTRVRMYKVQIKARRAYGKKTFIVKIAKSNEQAYTSKEVDIIALYIEDNNSWYIFPLAECNRVIRINLKGGIKERYRNNWKLFETV